MSDANILLGYIEEPKASWQPDPGFFRRANDAVLAEVPADDKWPPIYRSLFTTTGEDDLHGTFRTRRLIYFGGQFNGLISDLPEWLDKFEALLRRLYWCRAEVLVMHPWSGPPLALQYQAAKEAIAALYSPHPSPPQQWTLAAFRLQNETRRRQRARGISR